HHRVAYDFGEADRVAECDLRPRRFHAQPPRLLGRCAPGTQCSADRFELVRTCRRTQACFGSLQGQDDRKTRREPEDDRGTFRVLALPAASRGDSPEAVAAVDDERADAEVELWLATHEAEPGAHRAPIAGVTTAACGCALRVRAPRLLSLVGRPPPRAS